MVGKPERYKRLGKARLYKLGENVLGNVLATLVLAGAMYLLPTTAAGPQAECRSTISLPLQSGSGGAQPGLPPAVTPIPDFPLFDALQTVPRP